MALIGPLFSTVTVLTAAVAFVAAVCWWPRWSEPGLRMLVARGGVLLTVNALLLLAAAVLVNNTFGFFADWSDLVGATGATGSIGAAGGTGRSIATLRGGADARAAVGQAVAPERSSVVAGAGSAHGVAAAGLRPPLPVPLRPIPPLPAGVGVADPVHTYTVTGARSGIRAQVVVELPRSYFDPTQSARRYPVIETFNGYPGQPDQWVAGMGLGRVWKQQSSAHLIGDAIIVSPALEYPAGVDSECVDGGAAGPQVETWVSQDVPDWVVATFRSRVDRQSWATIGLSAGGWCAALVTMHHPDRYSAAIVLGGYFRPDFSRYVPFAADSPAGRRDDLVRLAATAPPPVALWLQTSQADPLSYGTSKALIAAARPPLSVQSTVLAHAGHRFSIWQQLLPQALQWLGHAVPGFVARP